MKLIYTVRLTAFFSAVLLALVGCGTMATKTETSNQSKKSGDQNSTDLSWLTTEEQFVQFGYEIQKKLNDDKYDEVGQSLDLTAFKKQLINVSPKLAKFVAQHGLPKEVRQQFVASIKEDVTDDTWWRFIRLVREPEGFMLLFEAQDAFSSTIKYIKLGVEINSIGNVALNDFHNVLNGLSYSGLVSTNLDLIYLSQIQNNGQYIDLDEKQKSRLSFYMLKIKKQMHAALISDFLTLESPLKENAFINYVALASALSLEDEKYNAVLRKWQQNLNEPLGAYFWVEYYYFIKQDMEATQDAINAFNDEVNLPGYSQYVLGILNYETNPKQALVHLARAIELDPMFESAYFYLWTHMIRKNQFEEALLVFKNLYWRFSYYAIENADEISETYRAFYQSKPYLKWQRTL